jgi:hypothetical protein
MWNPSFGHAGGDNSLPPRLYVTMLQPLIYCTDSTFLRTGGTSDKFCPPPPRRLGQEGRRGGGRSNFFAATLFALLAKFTCHLELL